jgi:hypothetical protein
MTDSPLPDNRPKLPADEFIRKIRSEPTSDAAQLTLTQVLTSLFAGGLLDLLRRLNPSFVIGKPLPPSTVGPEVPLTIQSFAQLVTAAATQDNQGLLVWTKDDSALVVVTGKITLNLADGLMLVNIPVMCDQIESTIQVPFAVGGAQTPAGMLVATEEHPRGPDPVIVIWSEALIAFAWQILLTVVTRVAAATGTDTDGAGLIPVSITATPDGVRVLTMARHAFDRVSA